MILKCPKCDEIALKDDGQCLNCEFERAESQQNTSVQDIAGANMESLKPCPDCNNLMGDFCFDCDGAKWQEKAKTQLIKISNTCPGLTAGDVLVYRDGEYFIASQDETDSDFGTGCLYWEREYSPDDFYEGDNAKIRDDDMWMYLPEPPKE